MIGIFDSGVGGLTVAKEILKQMPDQKTIYFGDTARVPYGTKGEGFVKKYSAKITEWLLGKKAKIIVIACHTSSAWAADFLKKEYKNTPIFDMISFSAKKIGNDAEAGQKIGIIGTPGTIESGSWEKALKKENGKIKIFTKSCPLFVPMAEMGFTKGNIAEEVAEEYLKELKSKKIDVLVLACTHYPLLKETIKKVMGPEVKIINPAEIISKEIKKYLEQNPNMAEKGSQHKFYFSDKPYNLEKISQLCFNKKIKPIINDPFI